MAGCGQQSDTSTRVLLDLTKPVLSNITSPCKSANVANVANVNNWNEIWNISSCLQCLQILCYKVVIKIRKKFVRMFYKTG